MDSVLSPTGRRIRPRLPVSHSTNDGGSSTSTRSLLRESLEDAAVRSPPPTTSTTTTARPSIYQTNSVIFSSSVSYLQDLETKNSQGPLYTNVNQMHFSDITFVGILGHGKWSTVYHVQLSCFQGSTSRRKGRKTPAPLSKTRQGYALKCLHLDRMGLLTTSTNTTTRRMASSSMVAVAEEFYRETVLLANCNHRNIVSLHGVAMEGLVGSFDPTYVTSSSPNDLEEEESNRDQYGYYISLDIISETLAQRIARWRQSSQPGTLRRLSNRFLKPWIPGWRTSTEDISPVCVSTPICGSLDFANGGGGGGGGGMGVGTGTGVAATTAAAVPGDITERIEIVTAIANAMNYLHTKHRYVIMDLCPETIGFDAQTGIVKLFDFHLARVHEEAILHIDMDRGNPRYMAPEMMICQSSGLPGDIYSFGVVFWELMTLQRPYDAFFSIDTYGGVGSHGSGGDGIGGYSPSSPSLKREIFEQFKFTEQVILNRQWRPSCTSIADGEIRRLIQECWCAEPEARPDAKQVLWRLQEGVAGQQPRRSSYTFRRSSYQSQPQPPQPNRASSSSGTGPRPPMTERRGSRFQRLRDSFRKKSFTTTNATHAPIASNNNGRSRSEWDTRLTGGGEGISGMVAAAAAVAADLLDYSDDDDDDEVGSEEPPFLLEERSTEEEEG